MARLIFRFILKMQPRLERNKNFFRVIATAPLKEQKRLLSSADRDFIFSCHDCCKNILDGCINIPSKSQQKLFRYKTAVRKLGQSKPLSLMQTGGFFTVLIPILSSLIGPVLSSVFGWK